MVVSQQTAAPAICSAAAALCSAAPAVCSAALPQGGPSVLQQQPVMTGMGVKVLLLLLLLVFSVVLALRGWVGGRWACRSLSLKQQMPRGRRKMRRKQLLVLLLLLVLLVVMVVLLLLLSVPGLVVVAVVVVVVHSWLVVVVGATVGGVGSLTDPYFETVDSVEVGPVAAEEH